MELKNITKDESGCFFPLKAEMALINKDENPLFEMVYHNFQSMVFHLADQQYMGYFGGSWDLCRAASENGDFHFLVWNNEKEVEFTTTDTKLPSDLAGLVLSMMAWSHLSFHYHKYNPALCDFVSKMYHRTRSYVWNNETNGYLADKMISTAILTLPTKQADTTAR